MDRDIDTNSSQDDSYQDLIDAGIDHLNSSESYDGTRLEKEEQLPEEKSHVFSAWWFKTAAALCIVSLVTTLYFDRSAPKAITLHEANRELRVVFGPDFDEVAPFDSEDPVEGYRGINDPKFLEPANRLNNQLLRLDGDEDGGFPIEGYNFLGSGYYWSAD